ncbi:MAG TPA: MBL fold metallo-hydrolase [Amnibacterium sp.]|jgi:L-ascorbate metabolism protein UlaG (beta-lactamase superfamily)|uniref:MBL fold metallo-hydrolase n=1 Tax=Amnibacterium sp. TaxID=1872496 RepID=UPI002F946914
MRITKLEHAALLVEEGGHRLVVDPGSLTNPIVGLENVQVIVITHEHADHWTAEQLRRILEINRNVVIFGPEGVAKAAEGFDVVEVHPGETHDHGDFVLKFFGGRHAVIHPSIPVIDNVGVLINNRLYYPGDSFTVPESVVVETLAAPAGAPWMKISEAMDYVTAVAPKRAFPTHDGVLSAAGKAIANDRLKAVTEAGGGQWYPLQSGDFLDI